MNSPVFFLTRSIRMGKKDLPTEWWSPFQAEQMKKNLNDTNRCAADLKIAERAQKGDSEAFAVLFHAHKARIYSICLRMSNNTAQAEDLTQDAFLQVFRKLSTFKGNSTLSTWLYRIAVNTVLMNFRKKASKQISLDEPDHDATMVHREYGSRDGRLSGAADDITLTRAIRRSARRVPDHLPAARSQRLRAPGDCENIGLLGGKFQVSTAQGQEPHSQISGRNRQAPFRSSVLKRINSKGKICRGSGVTDEAVKA